MVLPKNDLFLEFLAVGLFAYGGVAVRFALTQYFTSTPFFSENYGI